MKNTAITSLRNASYRNRFYDQKEVYSPSQLFFCQKGKMNIIHIVMSKPMNTQAANWILKVWTSMG